MLLIVTLMTAAPLLPPICRAPTPAPVAGERSAKTKKLGDLPPVEHFVTIYLRENGCMIPVRLRDRA